MTHAETADRKVISVMAVGRAESSESCRKMRERGSHSSPPILQVPS